MRKLIFVVALLAALVATPALATAECPTGTHWVEENTTISGYFTNGECNSWEQVCGWGSWHCDRYSHGFCVDWDRDWECHNGACNGYEQVWVPEQIIPGGSCVADEVIPTPPTPPTPPASVLALGFNPLALTPLVSTDMYNVSANGDQITVNFLCRQFSYGKLLVSLNSVPFAVSTYGKKLTSNGEVDESANGTLYGYTKSYEDNLKLTYHTITFTSTKPVYVRPICVTNGSDALGSEKVIY